MHGGRHRALIFALCMLWTGSARAQSAAPKEPAAAPQNPAAAPPDPAAASPQAPPAANGPQQEPPASSEESSEETLERLRKAVALAPQDAALRGKLAAALFEDEQYDEAIGEAEAALRLGPGPDDQRAVTATLKKARTERLKQRLSISASAGIGYDSNIQQGTSIQGTEIQTIAGRSTGSASRTVGTRSRPRSQADAGVFRSDFASAITNIYNTPTPSLSEAGVPIPIDLEIKGRLAAGKRIELWLGYSFSQLIQTLPDQDAYNFQQHDVALELKLRPKPWLSLDVSATGFANFSGLQSFAPFQGGIAGAVSFTFKESARWRTLLQYEHKYAASFAAEDSALNADSDELFIAQELRLKPGRPLRLRLAYRLRDVRSGVLEIPVGYEVTGGRMNQNILLGEYLYTTPLGYLGNKVAARLRAELPADFTVVLSAGYEYRLYDGVYAATFTPATPQLQLPQGSLPTRPVTLPAKQRTDHVVGLDLSVEKELPLGFSLSLSYAFLDNLSNIANSLDNRSYVKHTVSLSGSYSF